MRSHGMRNARVLQRGTSRSGGRTHQGDYERRTKISLMKDRRRREILCCQRSPVVFSVGTFVLLVLLLPNVAAASVGTVQGDVPHTRDTITSGALGGSVGQAAALVPVEQSIRSAEEGVAQHVGATVSDEASNGDTVSDMRRQITRDEKGDQDNEKEGPLARVIRNHLATKQGGAVGHVTGENSAAEILTAGADGRLTPFRGGRASNAYPTEDLLGGQEAALTRDPIAVTQSRGLATMGDGTDQDSAVNAAGAAAGPTLQSASDGMATDPSDVPSPDREQGLAAGLDVAKDAGNTPFVRTVQRVKDSSVGTSTENLPRSSVDSSMVPYASSLSFDLDRENSFLSSEKATLNSRHSTGSPLSMPIWSSQGSGIYDQSSSETPLWSSAGLSTFTEYVISALPVFSSGSLDGSYEVGSVKDGGSSATSLANSGPEDKTGSQAYIVEDSSQPSSQLSLQSGMSSYKPVEKYSNPFVKDASSSVNPESYSSSMSSSSSLSQKAPFSARAKGFKHSSNPEDSGSSRGVGAVEPGEDDFYEKE